MKYKYLIAPAYITAFLLIAIPLGETLLAVRPLEPTILAWRVRAVGVVSSSLLTPFLGLFLAVGVAAASKHRVFLRVLSVLSILGALGLLAVMVLFALDAVQFRAQIEEVIRGSFEVGMIQTGVKQFLLFIGAFWLGVGGLRTAKRVGHKKEAVPLPRPAAK